MSTQGSTRTFDILCVGFNRSFPFDLSEKDLLAAESIEKTVGIFDRILGSKRTLTLIPTFINSSFCAFYDFFPIPTCCFSEETQKKIDKTACEQLGFALREEDQQTIDKEASTQRMMLSSYAPDELEFIIGHETGHTWLIRNFKAFNSQSLKVGGETVADLKHDRAQERICDFIGIKLSSPDAGIRAMEKISMAKSSYDAKVYQSHPSCAERIE
jgi:hypothetical protein